MKDKILNEVINWYQEQDNKDKVFIEDFVDKVIDRTTELLFDEIKDGLNEEFKNGNLKHPFVISSDYYLHLKLTEIKDNLKRKMTLIDESLIKKP